MPGAEIRIFLAHSIQTSDEDIDAMVQQVAEIFRVKAPNVTPNVVAGRDDYNKRFRSAGGWGGWGRSITGNLLDGQPRYHAIVVPAACGNPGRATQQIIKRALEAGRDVLELRLDGTLGRLQVR